VEGEPVFTHAGFREYPWESEGPERLRTERLRQTVTRLSSASGASVFVSKRIAHNQRIPQLLQALPEARFVAIVRDGRAVALSLSRVNWWPDDPLWWDGRSPRELEAEGADPWELCARNWVEDMRSIEEGLTDVPADRVLRLRYEDVVAAPRDAVVGVGRFIGLDADPRWLRALDMVRTQDRPEKWRTLPPQALATVERVQRSTLLHYGYDV
jgi:hypothetical protein